MDAIDEASFGSEHPRAATRLNNLAALLQDTNRLDEAERLIAPALVSMTRALGVEHPSTQTSLANFNELVRARGGDVERTLQELAADAHIPDD